MHNKEFEIRLFKKCVRKIVDDSTHKRISDMYNQKLTVARMNGYKKSDLDKLFKD